MKKITTEVSSLYGLSDVYNNSIRIAMKLKDIVNGDVLRKAVDIAMVRYPYFSVEVIVRDEEYSFIENARPVVIVNGSQPVCIGSEKANFHLVALGYEDNIIYFDAYHGITDGKGLMPWVKTILYYYLSLRYNIKLDSEGVNLADSEIDPEEVEDPYSLDFSEDIHPSGAYVPIEVFHLSESSYIHSNERTAYHIKISEEAFMKYLRKKDGTPATITSVLMYKVIQNLHGDLSLPIVSGVAYNYRNAINKPKSYKCLSTLLHLKYPSIVKDYDIEKLAICSRGMIMLQSQPENSQVSVRNRRKLLNKFTIMPDIVSRKEIMKQLINRALSMDTFKISYVGKVNWGSLEKYIDSMYSYVDIWKSGITIEISAINGFFNYCFMQEFSEDIYIKKFVDILKAEGIECQVDGPYPINIAKVKI